MSEVIIKKSGRPFGSIIDKAICRSPKLKREQKIKMHETYKLTPSYIKAKINLICKRYNFTKLDLDNKTEPELNKILTNIKIDNLLNRANLMGNQLNNNV